MIPRKCVIIGGAASGVLCAWAIRKALGKKPLELTIVDPATELGRGRAYAYDPEANDLLNVPAAKMGADPEHLDEFAEWLGGRFAIPKDFAYWPFVPRSHFGDYLAAKIRPLLGPALTHRRATVRKIRRRGKKFQLELDRGTTLEADLLVLCTGYGDPTRAPAFAAPGRRALIVGSGLSAIDLWRRLRKKRADREVTFLSRRGLLPLPHLPDPRVVPVPRLHGLSPRRALARVRRFAAESGARWPDIADAIRPRAAAIWAAWSARERRRFVRHLRPYWEVMRHRMPAPLHAQLQAELANGGAKIVRGDFRAQKKGRLTYRPRGQKRAVTLACDSIHLALGAPIDQRFGQGLRGLRGYGPSLGYVNESVPNLWLVGPPSKGDLWEATALHEIRAQAAQVAREIARAATAEKKPQSSKKLK